MNVHIALAVRDLDASVRFYAALLESAPVKQRPGYAKFLAPGLGLNLTLNEHTAAVPESAPAHFGIQLEASDEVSARAGRMAAAGYAGRAEEQVTCCYAVQDKFWFADPDGRAWEVYTVLADAEVAGTSTVMPAVSSGAACCAPAASGPCCGPSATAA
jgi:catechol 2,3-dioxygenase-like lactoylglutathione lyase family enzyme